jgi:putative FmdB family regulatory protein
MIYPYRCPEHGSFEVEKPMADSDRAEPCPVCGAHQSEQDIQAKRVGGYVSTDGNWTGGKRVIQLHPNHPDAMVSSKRQMEQVYKKHGISMETGKYVSKEAQIAGTVPRRQRTGKIPDVVGGVDD